MLSAIRFISKLSFFTLFVFVSHTTIADEQKAVLVTGASTGIGRMIAEDFASAGHFVYAGARKQKDLDALNKIKNIKAIRLDVTVQEEIDAAVKTIAAEGKGLYGLVNNAGVFLGAPVIEVDVEDLKWLMDINVNGIVRVTKAFAPMIIESKGRIANISSIAGIATGSFLSGPYSMSKHAVEAYTDALASELSKFDVQVSAVEPGNYNSNIAKSAIARLQSKGADFEGSYYQEELTAQIPI